MKNIVVFASGSGSNAQKIMEFYQHSERTRVSLIVSDNAQAGVLERAKKFDVPSLVISGQELRNAEGLLNRLQNEETDLIVLAGFLRMIPAAMVQQYDQRIVNIHPALLPKFGGKGMYGERVHQAVIDKKEDESGITIHYVNEHYDEGAVIFQATCPVFKDDTPETLAERIHGLEHEHYPKVVDQLIDSMALD